MSHASRLLIVEDDPNDLELICLALDDCPFSGHIDVANDGEQALHYLYGPPEASMASPLPRLVLLDLKLPKIDGRQVLEQIRVRPRTRHLPVVVMTSSAEPRDIEACYALGANSYIVKPLEFQEFQDVSRQVGVYWMQLNQPVLVS